MVPARGDIDFPHLHTHFQPSVARFSVLVSKISEQSQKTSSSYPRSGRSPTVVAKRIASASVFNLSTKFVGSMRSSKSSTVAVLRSSSWLAPFFSCRVTRRDSILFKSEKREYSLSLNWTTLERKFVSFVRVVCAMCLPFFSSIPADKSQAIRDFRDLIVPCSTIFASNLLVKASPSIS